MKSLMMTSVFTLIPVFAVHAADVAVFHKSEPDSTLIATPPAFSWTGFYLGAHVGGFSSDTVANVPGGDIPPIGFSVPLSGNEKWEPLQKSLLPDPSGFMVGFYAGSNIDLGNHFILGVDTDVLWVGRKDTKNFAVNEGEEYGLRHHSSINHTLEQKWVGATRLQAGLSINHVRPYIAGGVAYTGLQDILSLSLKEVSPERGNVGSYDAEEKDTKTMIGYTIGAGVDFALTNNAVLRAEYRHSDFGKKKFSKDKIEIGYKTDDFRVGVAYKF
ncbi:hemin binding protein [Bartonella australis AUST/NH1]|uniref:Hemin binding protein n=1 Tax=Bartonella australis (strain Aust/NH1) TaxID=1094489 RepID=M1PBR5_BARAA|nr:outer membrane protein [Bartonella australis]AGF74076.1 hemin binding protein [Bartonella australis AUST/NH1]